MSQRDWPINIQQEAAARVAGAFLSAALVEIVQEWPRDGALLTVGVAPAAPIIAARFNL